MSDVFPCSYWPECICLMSQCNLHSLAGQPDMVMIKSQRLCALSILLCMKTALYSQRRRV
jgi:hypothetical protein